MSQATSCFARTAVSGRSAASQRAAALHRSLKAPVGARRTRLTIKAAADMATSADTWEFCMSKEALLKSPNRRAQGDIPGVGKVALFWFKNEAHAVQGQCPHLGIPLAGGQLTPEGTLVCSQHKSSWKVESGEVEEWLPGNFINAVQRMVSPACPLEKFDCKIDEEGNIYVKVP
mmetsp:Transcript_19185/g.53500  ORF Transcript_19185/g.53500 Transcript_19185/m.53500 type:complete len:174 (-) Transcript_19185:425-946(-)|eukprot:CAMPEP_0117663174 /NCGR_PEP_ID=MMETSP0804-20121206/8453_1 /TAXON_ID=1074897 /ORGANISM="Tetraselmis astigmatica, Strain CCMP880" /LENGTH=173 /DNA_ID=CAMNT_0005470137 /DNA_START=191 /DNA_END=712 /DNA_ORIENTATION=-